MMKERKRIVESFWAQSFIPMSTRPNKGSTDADEQQVKTWSVFARVTKMGGLDEVVTDSDEE